MANALPATIAESLQSDVEKYRATLNGYADVGSFEMRKFLRDADSLSRVDAVAGSVVKAVIFNLAGDIDASRRWLANAKTLAPSRDQRLNEGLLNARLGYFNEAAAIVESMIPETSFEGRMWSSLAVACGLFSTIAKFKSERPWVFAVDPTNVENAEMAAMSFQMLGVPEERLLSILHVAGEVLREHHVPMMVGANGNTLLHGTDASEGFGFLYELAIPVDSARAFAMTEEVVERLLDRDLYTYGVSFCFIAQESE